MVILLLVPYSLIWILHTGLNGQLAKPLQCFSNDLCSIGDKPLSKTMYRFIYTNAISSGPSIERWHLDMQEHERESLGGLWFPANKMVMIILILIYTYIYVAFIYIYIYRRLIIIISLRWKHFRHHFRYFIISVSNHNNELYKLKWT